MFVAPASLLNSISLQIPSVMLLALYGPEVAGWYLLVQRIGAIPATLISASVAQVFLGEAARVARDDPSALPGLFSADLAQPPGRRDGPASPLGRPRSIS
jgi:O-antigen/teichoic acid export membrane protein